MHLHRRTPPRVFAPIRLTVAALLLSPFVRAQTALPSAPSPAKPHAHTETSISVGAMGQLAATRIQSTSTAITTQSLTPSPGVFATFRQTFQPWLGYSVNIGYAQPTSRETITPVPGSRGLVTGNVFDTHAYEVSLSYIAHAHLTTRLSLFGEAGAGTVGFAAINNGLLPRRSNAFRPAGIAGAGVDYRLPHGLGLRAQYRGLFVKFPFPDDDNSNRFTTILSQPTVSLTYTFHSGNRSNK